MTPPPPDSDSVSFDPSRAPGPKPRLVRATSAVAIAAAVHACVVLEAAAGARPSSLAPPGILALASGLWLLAAGRRIPAQLLAWTGTACGLAALVPWVALAVPWLESGAADALRAAGTPVPAVLLAILGGAAVLRTRRALHPPSPLLGFASSVVVAFGIALMAVEALGVPADVGWGPWYHLSMPGTAALASTGLAASVQAWDDSRSGQPGGPRFLPALVGLGALAATVALWQALEFQRIADIRDRIERRLDVARHDVGRELAGLVPVLSSMPVAGDRDAAQGWPREAALRFHERADIVALGQVKADGTPRLLLARPGRTDVEAQGLVDASIRLWLAGLPTSGFGVVAGDAWLGGAPALIVAVPAPGVRPDTAGWTLALCDLRELTRRALAPSEGLGVALEVTHQSGVVIYRNRATPTTVAARRASTVVVGPGGPRVTIAGLPTAALVAAGESALPAIVLLLGSALALALGIVVALGQRAAGRSTEAQRTTQQLLEALVDRNIAREALERREALLQTVLETMGEGVVAASASGEFLVFNRAARELLGIDGDDGLDGLEWADLIVAAEPAVWPATDRALERALHGERIDDLDICLRPSDGREPRWVSVFARPLALPFGVTGSMLVLRDVTERRLAQERLTGTARELERSNRELTEFASVASHDLRAPLRSIRSFVELLSEDYGQSFNDDGREFVARIRAAVTRMTNLIDGLLALARVRAKGEPFAPVDLGEVVHEVIADLAGPIDESGAVVHVEALPTVVADRLQMRQLLQNLIANAVKFRRADVAPQVEVSARRAAERGRTGSWELRVRDNGIGLDPASAERIFRPFERLHGHSAFEGSGLGLAVCARIVERHGGGIHVEAAPGLGATFVVSLPASRRQREAA